MLDVGLVAYQTGIRWTIQLNSFDATYQPHHQRQKHQ